MIKSGQKGMEENRKEGHGTGDVLVLGEAETEASLQQRVVREAYARILIIQWTSSLRQVPPYDIGTNSILPSSGTVIHYGRSEITFL